MGINPYLKVDKSALVKLRGDPAAMFWYACLTDYSKRFKPDKYGYVRIARQTITDDYGLSVKQLRYLNRKLAGKGVIALDPVKRGHHIPTGYKLA